MPHVELVEVSSSTRAAEIAKNEANAGRAGQCVGRGEVRPDDSRREHSGLQRERDRFLVIGASIPRGPGNDKTSIMFAAQDRVGALHDSLATFKRHKINLTKIESRPSKKKAWEYYFFVDCTGHCDDAKVKKALSELAKHTMFVKILGSYPNVNG